MISKLFFDGACSRQWMGEVALLIPPIGQNIALSFKLEFDATYNVVKYEELILGLETTKNMGAKNLTVIGDYKVLVLQTRNIYTTNHLRMRSYRNAI